MKVLVGTKNTAKIEGCQQAFQQFFEEVEIVGISVPSDVSDQPVNEAIYQGAKNRVNHMKRYALDNNIAVDYYVAIESGITNQIGKWVNISIAVIENNERLESFGCSAGYPIPERYLTEIMESSLGEVMDRIFDTASLGKGKGGIHYLTKGNVTRQELTKQACVMALTTHFNHGIWVN